MSSPSIYYDVKTNSSLRITAIENSLSIADDHASTKLRDVNRRISYKSNGCTCQDLTCGCCVGINLQQFNFNREGCMNFTYDPLEFAIGMEMLINNEVVFLNQLSGIII